LPLLRSETSIKSVAVSASPLTTHCIPPSIITCMKSISSSAVPAASFFDDFEDEEDELEDPAEGSSELKNRLSRVVTECVLPSNGRALAQSGVISESA
jgi:hypothetical protein